MEQSVSFISSPTPSPIASTTKQRKKWPWIVVAFLVVMISGGLYFYLLVRGYISDMGVNNINYRAPVIATDDDPYIGPVDSPVVVVEFSDFQCPYCYQSFPVVRRLISQYSDRVKFIYRDFPLSAIHPQAEQAAEAGECAHEQGKFWEMHDKLFINRDNLTVPALKQYAREIELNTDQFNECLDTERYAAEVKRDFNDGYSAGVDGTPTYFINNQKFDGVPDMEQFQKALDKLIDIFGL